MEIPKSPPRSPSTGSEDTDDEDATSVGKDGVATSDGNVLKNRREKRLAMNRASARARRRRKKELLGSLAGQVQELTNQNQMLQTKSDTMATRVEQLEAALTQAQATITALSSGSPAMQSSLSQSLSGAPPASAVSQMSDSALRSFLLGSGAGLQGASGLSGGLSASAAATYGDSLFNARALQQLELQNQLKLLGATSGLGGAAGLRGLQQASALQQQLASDRIGSLAGVPGLGSLLRGGIPAQGGMSQTATATATPLDSIVRAKAMGQAQEDEKVTSRSSDDSASKKKATGAGFIAGPPGKKPKI